MQPSNNSSSGYPASWQLPPGALRMPPAPVQDTRIKRRGHEREEEDPSKSSTFNNRHERVEVVALNIFLPHAGGRAIQIAGRCAHWVSPQASQELSNAMLSRITHILQTYQQEIPKAEVVRFYTDFMANPLALVRDRLAQINQVPLSQECQRLISQVNRMDETSVQDEIQRFLDHIEQLPH